MRPKFNVNVRVVFRCRGFRTKREQRKIGLRISRWDVLPSSPNGMGDLKLLRSSTEKWLVKLWKYGPASGQPCMSEEKCL